MSQLIVIILQLRRLHQAADLGSPVEVSLLLGCVLLLLLDLEELGIVASELLERDEEVTQVEPEFVVLRVESEQSLDKGSDLWAVGTLAMYNINTRNESLRLKVGKGVL